LEVRNAEVLGRDGEVLVKQNPVTGEYEAVVKALPGAKVGATFPEGISFNPSIKDHLSNFDGLTQRRGISGTHNLDDFQSGSG
ncbi:hypothetical protein, partial [Achromobacter sp. 413638]|uniref:hypothetical protein n=1 Tax=Achromobacter sp. 413638 TaxID=3342385 RepID=UPI00370A3E31